MTDTIDPLDPPVRTLADIEQERSARLDVLRALFTKPHPTAGPRRRLTAQQVIAAMESSGGKVRLAAAALKVSDATLYDYLHKLGLYARWCRGRGRA